MRRIDHHLINCGRSGSGTACRRWRLRDRYRRQAALSQSVRLEVVIASGSTQAWDESANIKFPQILNFCGQTPVRVCEWLT
jgi:hypothetical protein